MEHRFIWIALTGWKRFKCWFGLNFELMHIEKDWKLTSDWFGFIRIVSYSFGLDRIQIPARFGLVRNAFIPKSFASKVAIKPFILNFYWHLGLPGICVNLGIFKSFSAWILISRKSCLLIPNFHLQNLCLIGQCLPFVLCIWKLKLKKKVLLVQKYWHIFLCTFIINKHQYRIINSKDNFLLNL